MTTTIQQRRFSMYPYTLQEAVFDAFTICAAQRHKNERLPGWWVRRCYWDGNRDTLGLVALLFGVANMGRELRPAERTVLHDPAGEGWAGQPARNGKHWLDGSSAAPYGGLGIAHFDRSRWDDLAELFGDPGFDRSLTFDQMKNADGRDWRHYLEWADEILLGHNQLDNMVALVRLWLRHYWYDADEAHEGTVEADFVNVRIRNSASGIGAKAAGKAVAHQIRAYWEYKIGRSERAANRAMEQVAYSRRAWVALQHAARFEPFD